MADQDPHVARLASLIVLLSSVLIAVLPAVSGQNDQRSKPPDAQMACLANCPSRPGPFSSKQADPACVKKCLELPDSISNGRGIPPPATVSSGSSLPIFTKVWDADQRYQSQKGTVQRLLQDIGMQPVRSWIFSKVEFDRVSRGSVDVAAGVRSGGVTIYDPFFIRRNRSESQLLVYQRNILIFELGKAVWFGKINSGPLETATARQRQFNDLIQGHAPLMRALAFAKVNGDDLGDLADNDIQSQFAYAFRVVVLGLDLPEMTPYPRSYSQREWQGVKREWIALRPAFEKYLRDLFTT